MRQEIRTAPMDEEVRRAYAGLAAPEGIGAVILADLDAVFAGNPFVAGQADQTAFNCGALQVLEYLYEQMARAQEPAEQETKHGEG
jgi:hypothetical protein